MKIDMRIPPKSKSAAMDGAELAEALKPLIGRSFPLTDKPRTKEEGNPQTFEHSCRFLYCYFWQ